jgi:hypothetical protein
MIYELPGNNRNNGTLAGLARELYRVSVVWDRAWL